MAVCLLPVDPGFAWILDHVTRTVRVFRETEQWRTVGDARFLFTKMFTTAWPQVKRCKGGTRGGKMLFNLFWTDENRLKCLQKNVGVLKLNAVCGQNNTTWKLCYRQLECTLNIILAKINLFYKHVFDIQSFIIKAKRYLNRHVSPKRYALWGSNWVDWHVIYCGPIWRTIPLHALRLLFSNN